jgi:CubicO group peptidase (beta-lactamase class C family)
MSLESVHLKFDRSDKPYDILFQEEAVPTEGGVLINGRHYCIQAPDEQRVFLRQVISDLTSEKDILAGDLRGRLRSHPEVRHLSVTSSLSSPQLSVRMEAYIQDMVATKGFRGSVLVKRADERLIARGYGDANGVATRFCIGSVTKQFTGAAIMLLAQSGRLNLDVECNTVLPIIFQNPKWSGITVRHLLTHASGLTNYGPSSGDGNREALFTLEEIIALFKDQDLLFNPGAMHRYSNANYALLGAIIEQVSGRSYEEFLRERIFEPLGMSKTGLALTYSEDPPAPGFEMMPDGVEKMVDPREMPIHLSKATSAGSIISTIEDMQRWDQGLYDASFLTPASRREIAQTDERIVFDPEHHSYDRDEKGRALPKKGEAYPLAHYGCGVGVGGDGEALLHGGAIPGYTAFTARNTDTKECVIVLGNQMRGLELHDRLPVTEEVAMHLWEMLNW